MNFLTKNIRIISILVFAAIVVFTFLLTNSPRNTERTLFVFDTVADISISGKNSDVAADEIASALSGMEKTYSKYQSSGISAFNSLSPGETMSVTVEMADLIGRCLKISKSTDGAFDITLSALSDLWDVKNASTPPQDDDILPALEKTGYNKLKLNGNTLTKTEVSVDFGGVLKGFAADKVREITSTYGIKSGIVNLGGNVCLIGSKNGKPWTIGIVNPFSPGEIYLTVDAQNTNIITSGGYQRYFEHEGKVYHHILSPKTGYPTDSDVASATVISPDGTLADALSTAIFAVGSEKGMEIAGAHNVDAIIIKKDGGVIATEGVNYKLQN
ncbi:MAG: FAD:protein FMN transferase [Clostridia bacterium]|nr:FAD:protein FMN transferase [Clostridia bacterium]